MFTAEHVPEPSANHLLQPRSSLRTWYWPRFFSLQYSSSNQTQQSEEMQNEAIEVGKCYQVPLRLTDSADGL